MASPLARAYNRDAERLRLRIIDRMSSAALVVLRKQGRSAASFYARGLDPLQAIDPSDAALLRQMRPSYRAMVAGTDQRLRRSFGFRTRIDAEPILQAAGQRIVTVQGTTRDIVRRQLRLALESGLSDAQTERLLRGAVGDAYRAERIARTESALSQNNATAQAYSAEGIERVEVLDGWDCGWTSHDDGDNRNGELVSLADANAHPISHPNCVRSFAPDL